MLCAPPWARGPLSSAQDLCGGSGVPTGRVFHRVGYSALEAPGYCQSSLAGLAVTKSRSFVNHEQIVPVSKCLCSSFGAVHVVDHAIEAAGGAHI